MVSHRRHQRAGMKAVHDECAVAIAIAGALRELEEIAMTLHRYLSLFAADDRVTT